MIGLLGSVRSRQDGGARGTCPASQCGLLEAPGVHSLGAGEGFTSQLHRSGGWRSDSLRRPRRECRVVTFKGQKRLVQGEPKVWSPRNQKAFKTSQQCKIVLGKRQERPGVKDGESPFHAVLVQELIPVGLRVNRWSPDGSPECRL